MTKQKALIPDLPPEAIERLAFFLDFDGTLADVTDRPDETHADDATLRMLEALRQATCGAVAIVTGRALADVDRFLAPLVLPVAAEHGGCRRDAEGAEHQYVDRADQLAWVRQRLEFLIAQFPELILEAKDTSLSLHYRLAPELGGAAKVALESALYGIEGLSVKPGKMVLEARPGMITKGGAVDAFMREPPFEGRMPVCVGDDLTDEDAFEVANARDGVSIKIGEGETCAQHRFLQRRDFIDWLSALVSSVQLSSSAGGDEAVRMWNRRWNLEF